MKRIFHPYTDWEEINYNMWGDSKNRATDLQRAIIFTGNYRLYGRYMKRVIREWTVSCENHLTDHRSNRKAWLGHAAVAMALKIPEDIVREAWGHLDDRQRDKANEQAQQAIDDWERLQVSHKESHQDMGRPLLS